MIKLSEDNVARPKSLLEIQAEEEKQRLEQEKFRREAAKTAALYANTQEDTDASGSVWGARKPASPGKLSLRDIQQQVSSGTQL